jgi:hypothetical protein
MVGENIAEKEGHRNSMHPRRSTTIRCTVVFCIDINTSGDYIKLLHINKMNKLLLLRANEIIGDKSENPLI